MRPLKKISAAHEHDGSDCPFLQQRMCNTHICRRGGAINGGGSGRAIGVHGNGVVVSKPHAEGPSEVRVVARLPGEDARTLSEAKQQRVLDALAATIQAASEDPKLFQV